MTNANTNEQPSLSQIDKDMTDKFGSDLDSFMVNFTKTWESSVDVRSIIMTMILVLQKMSIETAEVISEDCAKQDFDIFARMVEKIEESAAEIKLKYTTTKH